jgi:hypothetical protein
MGGMDWWLGRGVPVCRNVLHITVEKGGSRSDLEQNGFDNDAESYEIYAC